MDEVYEAAEKRLVELEDEAKILRDFITHYRRTRYILGLDVRAQNRTEPERSLETPKVNESLTIAPKRPRVTDNPKPVAVVHTVLGILEAHGAPMGRKELHAALVDRGLVVRGANPIKTLGTMLWRSPRAIVHLEGHGYWIKNVPNAVAGYYPAEHAPQQASFALDMADARLK